MKRMEIEGNIPSLLKEPHIMSKTGRFETSTKTKIRTPHGTILKTVTYDGESRPFVEYNIRPICKYCKNPVGCVCFNVDNSDHPYEDAVSVLQGPWICVKIDCLLQYHKEDDPEYYACVESNFSGNKKEMAIIFSDTMPELEEGDFCPC